MSDVTFDEIRKVAAALDKNRISRAEIDAYWGKLLQQQLPKDLQEDLLNLPSDGDSR